nr:2'-5' RNA ligase family protein [Bryobacter aggregatus]
MFLDQMRRDLVPDCKARSHISLLPPRALRVPAAVAEAQIQQMSLSSQPFVVKIGDVSVFRRTSVIYLELEAGQAQLEQLHHKLSCEALEFDEPYPFHPHVTLAQNFELCTVAERLEAARERWKAYTGSREFLLDRVVFVQNSSTNCWTDLRSFDLKGLPVTPGQALQPQFIQTF